MGPEATSCACRYFFRGSNSENPFNCHYDVVTLDAEARLAQHRSPWVPVARIDPDTDVETLYFQASHAPPSHTHCHTPLREPPAALDSVREPQQGVWVE